MGVVEAHGLKERSYFMVTVVAPAEDGKAEIDLGRRPDENLPRRRHSPDPSCH